MAHFIGRVLRPVPVVYVTRFNLAMFGRVTNGRCVNLDGDWIGNRLDLFERYCTPKMAQQTDQRFRWLILIDPATDAAARARLRQAPNAELVEVPPGTPTDLAIRNCMASSRIITARLDSDDQISAHYTETLRAMRWYGERFALYFTKGLELNVKTGAYYARKHPLNQFAAAFERSRIGAFKTVHCRECNKLTDAMPAVLIKPNRPMWCTVVHGGNVMNEIRGTPTAAPPADW